MGGTYVARWSKCPRRTDTCPASLPANFAVWLASQEARFLRGKFVWAMWVSRQRTVALWQSLRRADVSRMWTNSRSEPRRSRAIPGTLPLTSWAGRSEWTATCCSRRLLRKRPGLPCRIIATRSHLDTRARYYHSGEACMMA